MYNIIIWFNYNTSLIINDNLIYFEIPINYIEKCKLWPQLWKMLRYKMWRHIYLHHAYYLLYLHYCYLHYLCKPSFSGNVLFLRRADETVDRNLYIYYKTRSETENIVYLFFHLIFQPWCNHSVMKKYTIWVKTIITTSNILTTMP